MDTIEQKDAIEPRQLTKFQKKQVLSLVDRFQEEKERQKRWFFIYCFSLGTLIKTVKCFVTRLTTELLETSSLRIIDVQLLGERREHSIVLFCFRFLSPIMRYYPSGMVNPLWDLFRRYISLKYSVINNYSPLDLYSGLFATQLWLFYNAICTLRRFFVWLYLCTLILHLFWYQIPGFILLTLHWRNDEGPLRCNV